MNFRGAAGPWYAVLQNPEVYRGAAFSRKCQIFNGQWTMDSGQWAMLDETATA